LHVFYRRIARRDYSVAGAIDRTAGTSPRRTLTAGGIQHHIEIAKQGIKPLPLMDNPHSGQPRRLVL
jgi:hypothetical protein